MVERPDCRCCRIWRSLPMTPYLVAPDRRRHHRRTRICEQQFREKEMSTSASSRSAAQPAGAGRSASELAGIGAASRVRVGAASMSNSCEKVPFLHILFRKRAHLILRLDHLGMEANAYPLFHVDRE